MTRCQEKSVVLHENVWIGREICQNTGADPGFKKGGGVRYIDVAKYIGALEVGGRGCCMHVNPPSFVQRLRHFGD